MRTERATVKKGKFREDNVTAEDFDGQFGDIYSLPSDEKELPLNFLIMIRL
jgi:hypothetical protein